MENVVVVIGAGQIGQAIARRVGVGKHIVLADRSEANANTAAEVMASAGYQVSVATVDVSSREAVLALVGKATGIGENLRDRCGSMPRFSDPHRRVLAARP
jgi:saccharopine dehydrogenase-like NADP-dependent oxidoreductase